MSCVDVHGYPVFMVIIFVSFSFKEFGLQIPECVLCSERFLDPLN